MNVRVLCLDNGCNLLKGHSGRCKATPNDPIRDFPGDIRRKLLKTKQTRGAQPYGRVPYQNRVKRSNKVVMPFKFRDSVPPGGFFEKGYVIMVRPEDIIDPSTREIRDDFPKEVTIGVNAFVFYDNRNDWDNYPPSKYGWEPRRITLHGEEIERRTEGAVDSGDYLARVPAITSRGIAGNPIVEGPPQGIRFYEYASEIETWLCMMQLAYLASKTVGVADTSKNPLPSPHLQAMIDHYKLGHKGKLEDSRVIRDGVACCPLCLGAIEAKELMNRAEQVEGREVVDLTVTEATLFHLKDLMPGEYNHRPYQLAWGHYHCNTVVRDNGIERTLDWMEEVLKRNDRI